MPSKAVWTKLADAALKASRRAYAPYSEFQVGAALMTDTGTIIRGCNVENASFGLCLCAERNALTTAVAAGHHRFSALAVATPGETPAPPCGLCLQMLAEFCTDLEILLISSAGKTERTRLAALLPNAFRWKGAEAPSI